jgi:hypothetical protein
MNLDKKALLNSILFSWYYYGFCPSEKSPTRTKSAHYGLQLWLVLRNPFINADD